MRDDIFPITTRKRIFDNYKLGAHSVGRGEELYHGFLNWKQGKPTGLEKSCDYEIYWRTGSVPFAYRFMEWTKSIDLFNKNNEFTEESPAFQNLYQLAIVNYLDGHIKEKGLPTFTGLRTSDFPDIEDRLVALNVNYSGPNLVSKRNPLKYGYSIGADLCAGIVFEEFGLPVGKKMTSDELPWIFDAVSLPNKKIFAKKLIAQKFSTTQKKGHSPTGNIHIHTVATEKMAINLATEVRDYLTELIPCLEGHTSIYPAKMTRQKRKKIAFDPRIYVDAEIYQEFMASALKL
jgi:hypothetical protein